MLTADAAAFREEAAAFFDGIFWEKPGTGHAGQEISGWVRRSERREGRKNARRFLRRDQSRSGFFSGFVSGTDFFCSFKILIGFNNENFLIYNDFLCKSSINRL